MEQSTSSFFRRTTDEERDKEEIIFANPVHHLCEDQDSYAAPPSTALGHVPKETLPRRDVRQVSSDAPASSRDYGIMPWVTFQCELKQARCRSNTRSRRETKESGAQLSSTPTLSETRISQQGIRAGGQQDGGGRDSQKQFRIRKDSILAVTRVPEVPFQPFAPTIDEEADKTLLEYKRFVSDVSLSHQSDGHEGVSDEKLVGLIIDGMISNQNDAGAQEKGLRSLRNLSYDEGRRSLIGASGGIRAAIDAMKEFPSNEALQELGLSFLTDVCQLNKANKIQVGHSGGIEVILASILGSSNLRQNLAESSSVTLWTCCHDCDLNKQLAGSAGAVDAILNVIRKGKRAISLHEKYLQTLLALITNNERNVALFREGGGSEELLAMLRQFPKEAIQVAALAVACELLRQGDGFRQSLGCAGIVDDIEHAFARYVNSKPYLMSCCGCLRYLAFKDSNRARMARGSIVSLLAETLERWKEDEAVAITILLALGNLTYDNARTKHMAGRNGGVLTLLSLLSLHKNRPSITEQTCRVLRNISDGRTNAKRECIRHSAVAAVATAMKAQPAAAGVQEHAAAMLLNLAAVESHELRTAHLGEHVERALALHGAAPRAQTQLMHLRDVLARTEPQSVSLAAMLFGGGATPKRANTARRAARLRGGGGVDGLRRASTAGQLPAAEEVLDGAAVASAVAALGRADAAVEY